MSDGTPNDLPAYATFVGAGFGTLVLRAPTDGASGNGHAPAAVSRRETLRRGLPGVYQDNDFTMRFVEALEQVLDPVAATLDGLHHYVDPDLAPVGVLRLMCAWLGVETEETQTPQQLRALTRQAAELGRWRGTVRGLELVLALTFPGLPLRVKDEGGISWPGSEQAPAEVSARFAVYCDQPIPEDRQAAVARCIEREKPAHTTFRLRVKAPKGGA